MMLNGDSGCRSGFIHIRYNHEDLTCGKCRRVPGPALFCSSKGIDGQNSKCCIAAAEVRLEILMKDVVELILNTYQSMRQLDVERAAVSRQKISRYLETLASTGQRDAEQLTIYGLAYLTELHEGQDPRFTGC